MKYALLGLLLSSSSALAQDADDYQSHMAVLTVEKSACETMAATNLKTAMAILRDADATQDELQDMAEEGDKK